MTVTFGGVTFAGTHSSHSSSPASVQSRIIKLWNVPGELELLGGPGGRDVVIPIVLHDSYGAFLDLRLQMQIYEELVGTNEELQISSGGFADVFRSSTYHGFEVIGDPRDGPLKDVAGTLDGGWWWRGTLKFRSLEAA